MEDRKLFILVLCPIIIILSLIAVNAIIQINVPTTTNQTLTLIDNNSTNDTNET